MVFGKWGPLADSKGGGRRRRQPGRPGGHIPERPMKNGEKRMLLLLVRVRRTHLLPLLPVHKRGGGGGEKEPRGRIVTERH